jgi:glyoxylase-like metal-dependent hydrolase (beta-lactamase superfamily II)/rhodanese-related sulfurtransferase
LHFQQFYLSCLSQASYFLASEGVAAVVDPQRDIELYVEEARANGFRIEYIIETHLHADFVSGHRELAGRTGAKIYLSAKADAGFPHVPVNDGDLLEFGKCRLKFLETPGHTMESICILVSDLEKSPEPFAVLTGDTLFIGDVGRPDLSPGLSPQELAGLLYDSLHTKLLTLDDSVAVYPAHGAGSLCGRQMRSARSSTIGEEKLSNYALRPSTREEFVSLLTSDLPERPAYFTADVELNRGGAVPVTALASMSPLTPEEVLSRQQAGAVVLDTRPAQEFGAAHIPGSLQIGLGGQFASTAGILVGVGPEVVLVAEDDKSLEESRLRLSRVGIDHVTGYLDGGLANWVRAGMPVGTVPQISAEELNRMVRDHERVQVVDVRQPSEWGQGHVPGATLVPLGALRTELGNLDTEVPIVVHCKGGYRSSIAASILKHAGFRDVFNLTGGFDAWRAFRLPEEIPQPISWNA